MHKEKAGIVHPCIPVLNEIIGGKSVHIKCTQSCHVVSSQQNKH